MKCKNRKIKRFIMSLIKNINSGKMYLPELK